MKATLEFNLDEPFERESHQMALKGHLYKIALDEIDNMLRNKIKYEDLPEAEETIYQAIRDAVRNIVTETTED